MRNIALISCISLTLSGCAGMNYAMDNYSGVAPVDFVSRGEEYRIFDKPNEQRMMVTPSLERSAGIGLVRGFTFGIAGNAIPKPFFENAVSDYLASTGRQCAIKDGFEIIEPQWEFRYSCALDVPPVIPALAKPAA